MSSLIKAFISLWKIVAWPLILDLFNKKNLIYFSEK